MGRMNCIRTGSSSRLEIRLTKDSNSFFLCHVYPICADTIKQKFCFSAGSHTGFIGEPAFRPKTLNLINPKPKMLTTTQIRVKIESGSTLLEIFVVLQGQNMKQRETGSAQVHGFDVILDTVLYE